MSNFFKEFDVEWLVISGKFLEKGAKIRPTPQYYLGVWSILPAISGLFLAKVTSLANKRLCERHLDLEQNGPNQNHQDFPFRLSGTQVNIFTLIHPELATILFVSVIEAL